MFGRKKEKPAARAGRSRGGNLSQFGLMDVPGADGIENLPSPDDEASLEAELAELMNDGTVPKEKKQTGKSEKTKRNVDLDAMVAACMENVPSDDEDYDDADVLDELAGLESDEDVEAPAPPLQTVEPIQDNAATRAPCEDRACAGTGYAQLVDERLENYILAEKVAQDIGDASKARRYGRGKATLLQLRSKLRNGNPVNGDDIPPSVSIPKRAENFDAPVTIPVEKASHTSPSGPIVAQESAPRLVDTGFLSQIKSRRDEAKRVALSARKDGNKTLALAALKCVKECDDLLKSSAVGEDASVPSLPTNASVQSPTPAPVESQKLPRPVEAERQFSRDDPIEIPANTEDIPPPDPSQFGAPPPPKTIEEALNQRLEKYRQDEAKAKTDGNASKARRLGRVCKQYTDAIKLHKAGKAIPVDDLPTPFGFGPIPSGQVIPVPVAATANAPSPSVTAPQGVVALNDGPAVLVQARVSPKPIGASQVAAETKKTPTSLKDKQLQVLQARQTQFREAALEAKKAGQVEQAKEYLRQFKGFDKLIEATKCGLPVDLNSLPVPPQKVKDVDMAFEIVSREDCRPEDMNKDRHDMYSKLEKDLIAQVKMCDSNRQHFKSTGDISTSNKFQQKMEHTKKDLDALRYAFKRGDPVPKFYYEVHSFSKIMCNTDLTDNDLEFNVIQGINYNVPNAKDLHSYCRLEFPYPKEKPFADKTGVVKDTNNPEYNHKVIIPVNSKEKTYQRVFKRQSAKVEVWSKGGFLRSDTLIGTASIKLQPLETKCEIHEGFVLMDGRKAVGGKVEVRIRVRNPIVAKQIEKVQEKWLVIAFN